MMMKKIERLAEIRGINSEERTAEFVISTESIDRHGTVFKMDGWELEAYNRNPIVCYNHDTGSNPDTVIGTSVVYKEGNQLIGKVTFEDEGDNEIAPVPGVEEGYGDHHPARELDQQAQSHRDAGLLGRHCQMAIDCPCLLCSPSHGRDEQRCAHGFAEHGGSDINLI